MAGEVSPKFQKGVDAVRHLQSIGKDYMYCKMWLVSNGYEEHAANAIWTAAQKGVPLKMSAQRLAGSGIYGGIIFLGGFLGSLLYFRLAADFNFTAATVFGFLFLRYSKFAMMRTPWGFAFNVHSDVYRERDPPEMRMFNYGVIAGFLYFFIALFLFPSFLGWTPASFYDEFVHSLDFTQYFKGP